MAQTEQQKKAIAILNALMHGGIASATNDSNYLYYDPDTGQWDSEDYYDDWWETEQTYGEDWGGWTESDPSAGYAGYVYNEETGWYEKPYEKVKESETDYPGYRSTGEYTIKYGNVNEFYELSSKVNFLRVLEKLNEKLKDANQKNLVIDPSAIIKDSILAAINARRVRNGYKPLDERDKERQNKFIKREICKMGCGNFNKLLNNAYNKITNIEHNKFADKPNKGVTKKVEYNENYKQKSKQKQKFRDKCYKDLKITRKQIRKKHDELRDNFKGNGYEKTTRIGKGRKIKSVVKEKIRETNEYKEMKAYLDNKINRKRKEYSKEIMSDKEKVNQMNDGYKFSRTIQKIYNKEGKMVGVETTNKRRLT